MLVSKMMTMMIVIRWNVTVPIVHVNNENDDNNESNFNVPIVHVNNENDDNNESNFNVPIVYVKSDDFNLVSIAPGTAAPVIAVLLPNCKQFI